MTPCHELRLQLIKETFRLDIQAETVIRLLKDADTYEARQAIEYLKSVQEVSLNMTAACHPYSITDECNLPHCCRRPRHKWQEAAKRWGFIENFED